MEKNQSGEEMEIIIPIVLILALIQIFLDKKIRKDLTYGGSISDTNGFAPYAWTIAILGVGTFIYFIFFYESYYVVGLILILLFGVRAIYEWIYIRATKRHVVSVIMTSICAIVTVLLLIV